MAAPPIITFTTDFGEGSHYIAQMKGAALSVNPQAALVDITHSVAPQNIRQGALALCDATRFFPPQTIHVAVVDPGVGTSRKILFAEIGGQRYIAPDNGLLSLLAQRAAPTCLIELTERVYWRDTISSTFHGRDIMAPVAGHLSLGAAPGQLGRPVVGFVDLQWPQPSAAANRIRGEVIAVDSFGNLITNISSGLLPPHSDPKAAKISCARREIDGISSAYGQRGAGEPIALWGSSDRLEIAIVDGNAAGAFGVCVGAAVEICW